LDRYTANPSLILGESTSVVGNSTFARFALDTKTNLLSRNNTASWAYQSTIHNAEGIVFAQDSYFVVIDGGDNVRSDIFRWTPGSWGPEDDVNYSGALPNGAQGICYKPAGEELWVVGSIPGERYVMAISQSLKTTSTGPVSASASASPAGKSLSRGVVAGIALGGVLGVGALCGAVLFFLRRRGTGAGKRPPRTGGWEKPELGEGEVSLQTTGAGLGEPELDGEVASGRAEMAEGNPRLEMG
jgi:hypothetical protein